MKKSQVQAHENRQTGWLADRWSNVQAAENPQEAKPQVRVLTAHHFLKDVPVHHSFPGVKIDWDLLRFDRLSFNAAARLGNTDWLSAAN